MEEKQRGYSASHNGRSVPIEKSRYDSPKRPRPCHRALLLLLLLLLLFLFEDDGMIILFTFDVKVEVVQIGARS